MTSVLDHPDLLTRQPYTVIGCWAQTRERYASTYGALTARSAETLAQIDAAEKGGTLWVCRIVPGEVEIADTYTAFVDPDDPRNADAEGLEADLPGFGDPDWTVFGIAVPPGTPDRDVARIGERYGDTVAAISAGAAEDVARDRLKDQGGVLMVCAVLEGKILAADTYASFVDPDVKAAS